LWTQLRSCRKKNESRQKDARLIAPGNKEAQQPPKQNHAPERAVTSINKETKEKRKDMDIQE
jgi:hypothetical protein